MVLWNLCSSVICSQQSSIHTAHANGPLICLPFWASSKGGPSLSSCSLNISSWISSRCDKEGPHYVTASVCQYVISGKLWHSYGPLLFSWKHPWALVHCRSSTTYLCRPPVLRNANDCQLQTAFKILTDVFHYKGRYLCHMLNCGKCMLRHLSLLLLGFGYLPKAYLNDDGMCW